MLKEKLPYSMLIKISKCGVFNLENIDNLNILLEREVCLSLLPCEVIHRAYPDAEICPCQEENCPWKNERGHKSPLIIIDCRTAEEQAAGIFPNSILLDSLAYEDTEYMLNFPDQFMPMRNVYHFSFMGSESYKGHNFNLSIFGKEEGSVVQNMMENLLQAFLMKGFSFLSFVEGGFEKCHDYALDYNIELESHDKNNCIPCQKLEKHNKSIMNELKVQQLNFSTRKSREIPEENLKLLKEMISTSEKYSNDEKFLFTCKKFDQNEDGNDEYLINISDRWIDISLVTPEIIHEIIREKISSIIKLTYIKKNPRVLCFRFADDSDDFSFMMKSVEEAKYCANQITKYLQMLSKDQ